MRACVCVEEKRKEEEEEENALSCFFLQQCVISSDQCTSQQLFGEHQTIVRQSDDWIGCRKPMVSVFYLTYASTARRSLLLVYLFLRLSLSRDFGNILLMADVELQFVMSVTQP